MRDARSALAHCRPGPLRLAAGFLLTAALAACGSAGTTMETFTCQPSCPAGTTCTAAGCVADGSGPDFAAGAGDLAGPGACQGCQGATPHCNPQGVCVACLVDGDCPTGTVCKPLGGATACVAGCGDDSRCGQGQHCCDALCVDTTTDPLHCGGCGMPCAADHAIVACVDGACGLTGCAPGWSDCNRNSVDGCEVNTNTDSAHCGACGAACKLSHAVAGCATRCYVEACEFGYDNCNADDADGCETAVVSDPRNCGACGFSCPPVSHARTACVNASCQLASCDVGFADCDGNPQNGCEVATGTDVKNCGQCGNACPMGLVCKNGGCTCPQCNFPNASSLCVNNVCVLDKCVVGFADCNLDAKDGCEIDLNTSAANCSACGMACDKGLSCIAGLCVAFRKNILLCGQAQRDISTFIPKNMNFAQMSSCNPDNDTQAMFVSRNWGNQINGNTLQTYLEGGGIVLTEFNISHLVYNLAFNAGAVMGQRNGGCDDTIPSLFQFNPNDPFWQDNVFQKQGNSGCGYSVSNYPGITTIMGWDANNAAIGYRDLGSGRFWATDFDWQDVDTPNGQAYAYTSSMVQYMVLHRH